MHRIPKWAGLLPAACLALLAAPSAALARPGPNLEHNETHAQIEQRYLAKEKVCDSFQGPQRERCLADAKAARTSERAAADAGHAEVAAKREQRDASGADKRASLHQAAEEELAVQRRIAMARCEEEPRSKRDACRDVVRARYGP